MIESDSEFLRRVMKTLEINQKQMSEILGVSQPAVSFTLRHGSRLQKAVKQELRRRMAYHEVGKVLASGKALVTFKPCRGHTITDFDKFMYHMEQCPTCMTRAFTHITKRK